MKYYLTVLFLVLYFNNLIVAVVLPALTSNQAMAIICSPKNWTPIICKLYLMYILT